MAVVELQGATKLFGSVAAVQDVTLKVQEGEFLTILGPSGSGKSTLLRAIAGFVELSKGRIILGGREITHLPANQRNVGMVFQHYALFPHMTVARNVGFGLEVRKLPAAEIRRRVSQVLEMVNLSGYEDRFPRQLSGGEQQRVALARALIVEPSVLLLDEPLGALDKRLRDLMQLEIKNLQKALRITTLFVTHNQEEALTMSDRIAVIERGRILQVGPPEEIYERPANPFVANFIGEINALEGTIVGCGESGMTEIRFTDKFSAHVQGPGWAQPGQKVYYFVRPENVRVNVPRGNLNQIEGTVRNVVYLGHISRVNVEAEGELFLRAEMGNQARMSTPEPGEPVTLSWEVSEGYLLRSTENL
ncbi:MAG: ABC transporter ATP-binding protein [Nitrospinota bacterium]